MTTTLALVNDDPAADRPADAGERRRTAVRAAVLAALGRPADLLRVAVVPLWDDRFRVNVFTGPDPTAARIPHSYFLAADLGGAILECSPSLRRMY